LKLPQENIGEILQDIGIWNKYLNSPPIAQEILTRIDKWIDNCTKLKSFYTAKRTITRVKRKPIEWEKIFASSSTDKDLVCEIYEELKKLFNPKEQIFL
jgi:hypothetical protein